MSYDENLFIFSHNELDVAAPNLIRSLWKDQDFVDVTLATADEKHINLHKVILSSASPFFRNILLKNVHINPLIYLKDIFYEDLNSILEFIYNGECSIANERLETFLESARELGIIGLNQDVNETKYNLPQSISNNKEKHDSNSPVFKEINNIENFSQPETKLESIIESKEYNDKTDNLEVLYNLPEKMKLKKSPKVCCQKCGKRYVMLGNLLQHMKESRCKKKKKLKTYGCSLCNKEVTQLNEHLKRHEKEPIQCDLCPVVKVSQLLIEKHKIMSHIEVTCPKCNIKLEGRSKLKNHRDNRHRPNKIRKCQHCSKEFATRSGLWGHVKNCIELKNMVSQIKGF